MAQGAGDDQDEARKLQMGQIAALQGAANGQGPSAAAIQQQQGLGQAVGGANAVAAGMHGASPMARMRAALDSQAGMSGTAMKDAAVLRAQEQLAARGQLAGAIQGARGQDLGRESDFGQQAVAYGGMANQAQQALWKKRQDDRSYWSNLGGGIIGGAVKALV